MNPVAANRWARICAYSTHAHEWEQFVRLVTPEILLTARRVSAIWGDASNATAHEIAQEVFLKLCEDDRRILRTFEDRGNDSFLKLLRVITASVATDLFRRMYAEKRGGKASAQASESLQWEDDNGSHVHATAESVEWPVLMGQLDGLLQLFPETVSARDRTLFWLYYRQGLTAEAISRIPAMNLGAKGVESALLRMTRLLRHTIENGKPKSELPAKKRNSAPLRKGFSPVVAIDTVEHR